MKFSIQLSAYYPDKNYGGNRVYADMLEQAMLADELGYDAVGITEHHLINILMMPAPLQFAVKIASMTKHVNIMTSVVVLPIHDMRILAGELVCADIFTDVFGALPKASRPFRHSRSSPGERPMGIARCPRIICTSGISFAS